ncbi:MAG: hypothetical protein KF903_10320 [Dokdonella sp.]|nr:hypothetical protein [Dokdonella sp.]
MQAISIVVNLDVLEHVHTRLFARGEPRSQGVEVGDEPVRDNLRRPIRAQSLIGTDNEDRLTHKKSDRPLDSASPAALGGAAWSARLVRQPRADHALRDGQHRADAVRFAGEQEAPANADFQPRKTQSPAQGRASR